MLHPLSPTPLALNLIVEGRVTGNVNENWDAAEDAFPECDYAAVEQEYEQARRYMAQGKSARGEGAVDLRLGCIYHMAGIRASQRQDVTVAADNFSRAERSLSRAGDHFRGDEAHIHMVQTHQILVAISKGGDERLLRTSAIMIGDWGRSRQSTSLTQFLGLLMMRYARYMDTHLSGATIARKALTCASLVFERLGDPVFKLQSLLERACLSKSAGVLNAAQLELDETLTPLEDALNFLHELAVASPSAASTITKLQNSVLTYFNHVAHSIYVNSRTGNRLSSWVASYEGYLQSINNKEAFGSSSITAAEVGNTTIASFTGFSDPLVSDRVVPSTSTSTGGGETLDAKLAALTQQVDQAIRTASELISNPDVALSFQLSQSYHEQYSKAHAALEEGEVDEYKAHLIHFLDIYRQNESSYRRNSQFSAGFKITALTLLNDFEQAREELPFVVPVWLGGKGTSSIEGQISSLTVNVESLRLPEDHLRKEAELAIAYCAQARDWIYGMQVMRAVQAKMPDFVSVQHKMPHARSWQLVTEMGAIYEHNGLLKRAFECYLRAREDLETRRCQKEEIDARLFNKPCLQSG